MGEGGLTGRDYAARTWKPLEAATAAAIAPVTPLEHQPAPISRGSLAKEAPAPASDRMDGEGLQLLARFTCTPAHRKFYKIPNNLANGSSVWHARLGTRWVRQAESLPRAER